MERYKKLCERGIHTIANMVELRDILSLIPMGLSVHRMSQISVAQGNPCCSLSLKGGNDSIFRSFFTLGCYNTETRLPPLTCSTYILCANPQGWWFQGQQLQTDNSFSFWQQYTDLHLNSGNISCKKSGSKSCCCECLHWNSAATTHKIPYISITETLNPWKP